MYCIKRVISCIYVSFLIVHTKISHCSWQRTPLAIATVFPFFFFLLQNPILSQKERKKMFCDKIVSTHLYTHTHTSMHYYYFFYLFRCNYRTFHVEDTSSRSCCVPLFFYKIIFWAKRKEKKICDFERNKIVSTHLNIRICINTFFFYYSCVNIVLLMVEDTS